MANDFIIVKGAKVHNLKNIDLTLPRNKLIVFTGLSGSGKSSLAFDTIFAEGQRRYVESLSAYARQFLGMLDKPDVDDIQGLSPAISIDQHAASHNPRSTVGTATEIYDYVRLLYSHIGHPHCPKCGREILPQTAQQIVDQILAWPAGTKIQVLAPLVSGRKGEYHQLLADKMKKGFIRARIDGQIQEILLDIQLDKNKKHTIELVVDRLTVDKTERKRLSDSVETALKESAGLVTVLRQDKAKWPEFTFSEKFSCPECGISLTEISPRLFSFNSPYGACKTCKGLGDRLEFTPELIVPDVRKSIADGGLAVEIMLGVDIYDELRNFMSEREIDLTKPIAKIPEREKQVLFHGGEIGQSSFRGLIPYLKEKLRRTYSENMRFYLRRFMQATLCPDCLGRRLRPEALAVTIAGKSIADITAYSIEELLAWLEGLMLTDKEKQISRNIIKEIKGRLVFLLEVGVGYLTLARATGTLSGGEAQRTRLATQIGSGLTGVLYILDEPTIGLHQRDDARLVATLKKLRDLGNTVIVVEHDRGVIEAADWLVDIGPGAGRLGGQIVFSGTLDKIKKAGKSLTGKYLSGELEIPLTKKRRCEDRKYLEVSGAREHNLKDIDVKFPLGCFTCVTGVSGSGKSSLVNDILSKALMQHFYGSVERAGAHREIKGIENIDKVIVVDQSPIGRTPRSNPATYTGLFAPIRDLFALVPEARARGWKSGRFSFNVKGGRCEACEGDGVIRMEMVFLSPVYVTCDVCQGKRYNRETLEVLYKGKNISEVLDMTVEEALEHFYNIPGIRHKLETLRDVGLSYIHLGQAATTLSGGEAQRIKLTKELSKRQTGRTLFILDEPTTGLHFADVAKLLEVLNRLVETGNTVLVIEHNMDVIKTADHIIDLGPEGGEAGGRVIASGTPEAVAKVRQSYTGQFLRNIL